MKFGPKQESLFLYLGLDKRRPSWSLLVNVLGHMLIGAIIAAPFLLLPDKWQWFALGAAAIAGALREVFQYVKNRQAHWLDRWWDASEAVAGAALVVGVL